MHLNSMCSVQCGAAHIASKVTVTRCELLAVCAGTLCCANVAVQTPAKVRYLLSYLSRPRIHREPSRFGQALLHMDTDPTAGFRKLNFLLSNPPFPPETFGNLLLLYCKYGYHEVAADILAENRYC